MEIESDLGMNRTTLYIFLSALMRQLTWRLSLSDVMV